MGRVGATKVATVVGVRPPALDALFDQAASGDPAEGVARWVNIATRAQWIGRSYGRVYDGSPEEASTVATLIDPQIMLPPVADMRIRDDEHLVLLVAEGPNLDRLGDTIAEAVGLRPEDLIPMTSLGLAAGAYEHHDLDHDLERATRAIVMLARWAGLAARPPLVVAHAETPDERRRAQALFNAAVPAYVRRYTPLVMVNSTLRSSLNELLSQPNITGDGPGASVPRGSIVVLHGQGETIGDLTAPVKVLAKTPLGTKDGRRLASAVRTAFDSLPADLATMASHIANLSTASAPQPTADASEDLARALASIERLEADLARVQAVVVSRDERIVSLRRELRSALFDLDAAQRPEPPDDHVAPEPSDEDVADDEAHVAPAAADASTPSTFADVFAAAGRLNGVILTDDAPDQVSPLVAMPKAASWARRTWGILTALDAYSAAREAGHFAGNFRDYLEAAAHPPLPPNQVILRESQALRTNRRFRAARVFPVPTEIHPDGEVMFEAHARIDPGGSYPAPRLYFLDDTNGPTGKVHVGYMGPHLPNFHTD